MWRKKADCSADNIKSVRITFRASNDIRPNLDPATTRAEDRIDFVSLDSQLKRLNVQTDEELVEEPEPNDPDGNDGNEDDLNNPLA